MTHANAPLNIEGRRRLVERCGSRPIAHVAAEAGVSRACLSRWKIRYDQYGEAGPMDRSSVPHSSPTQTPPDVVERIEHARTACGQSWNGLRCVRPYFDAMAFQSAAALVFCAVAVPLARLPARWCAVVRAWPSLQPFLPATSWAHAA
ncbi:hypothetical protein STSP_45660 [Streptomyces jeddahensis]|uniref:DNA-binding domain-containing protein n=1 Tax=Streptomyces jeddahensis TaxID=1716141 RepID=A0A177HMH5_9ACTN|nr:hypothetical protein STSP_45660 [Streptomyces jeddahensis]